MHCIYRHNCYVLHVFGIVSREYAQCFIYEYTLSNIIVTCGSKFVIIYMPMIRSKLKQISPKRLEQFPKIVTIAWLFFDLHINITNHRKSQQKLVVLKRLDNFRFPR